VPVDPNSSARTRQRGTTLVELSITILILSIVMAIAFMLLTTTNRSLGEADTTSRSTDQARLAIQQMDRQIRSGNVLNDPSKEGLMPDGSIDSDAQAAFIKPGMAFRVYTQANGSQRCVQWRVNTANKTLETRSWSENFAVDGDVSPWRIVAENIENTVGTATQAFSRGNYGDRLIEIRIITNVNAKLRKNITLESSVTGRNTEFGYSVGTCLTTPPY